MKSPFRAIRQKLFTEGKLVRYLGYAVGEVVLIIVGILFALKINDWNEDRVQRIQELQAITRIMADVSEDLSYIDRMFFRLERKERRLLKAEEVFSTKVIADPKVFLQDVLLGALQGWVQAVSNRATFNDLIGSGKLSIIENADIRKQISDYYEKYETEIRNMAGRKTPYPNMTRQFIPIDKSAFGSTLKVDLSEEELTKLADKVLHSDIKDHLTAELNFGRFVYLESIILKQYGEELLEALQAYYSQIE